MSHTHGGMTDTYRLFFCNGCGELLGVEDHIRIRSEHLSIPYHWGYRIVEVAPVDLDLSAKPTHKEDRPAHDYTNLAGESVHDGDAWTPPLRVNPPDAREDPGTLPAGTHRSAVAPPPGATARRAA